MYGVCVCMKCSVGECCVRAKQVVQQLSKAPGKTQRNPAIQPVQHSAASNAVSKADNTVLHQLLNAFTTCFCWLRAAFSICTNELCDVPLHLQQIAGITRCRKPSFLHTQHTRGGAQAD